MKVNLNRHPRNFFDNMKEITGMMSESRIPEMRLAARSLNIEIENLINDMIKNRVPDKE